MSRRPPGTPALLEPLERRRLFATNLFPNGGEQSLILWDRTVVPGEQNISTTYSFRSTTHWFERSVSVAFRLVPLNPISYNPAPNFDAPGGIPVGTLNGTLDGADGSVFGLIDIPDDARPGMYTLQARIDPDDDITESNESDNDVTVAETYVLRPDGVLTIDLTDGDDVLRLLPGGLPEQPTLTYFRGDVGNNTINFHVRFNDVGHLPPTNVRGVEVRGLGGNDRIVVDAAAPYYVRLDGGDGHDTLLGGDGAETLVGGAQKDLIYGGGGRDRLNGNGGNDKLFGDADGDRLFGYAGNDTLDGGSSNDRLDGGDGSDIIMGNAGDDRLFSRDGTADQLFGGKGFDSIRADVIDALTTVEPLAS